MSHSLGIDWAGEYRLCLEHRPDSAGPPETYDSIKDVWQAYDDGHDIDRLAEIAEALEDGEIGLEHAKELREEAGEHLETLRDALDVGDGDIIELDDVERTDDT